MKIKVIDLLKILLTQVGDIPKYIYFEDYKYEYDSKENDYFCKQLNFFLFMNVLGESLELNLDLPITIIEEDKEDTFNGLKWFADGKCFLSLSSEPLKTKDIEIDNEIKKWDYDEDCTDEWNFGEIKEKLDELVDAVNELKKGK